MGIRFDTCLNDCLSLSFRSHASSVAGFCYKNTSTHTTDTSVSSCRTTTAIVDMGAGKQLGRTNGRYYINCSCFLRVCVFLAPFLHARSCSICVSCLPVVFEGKEWSKRQGLDVCLIASWRGFAFVVCLRTKSHSPVP